MKNSILQRMLYSFITVMITVPAFVFYSVYVVEGDALKAMSGINSVWGTIKAQGGLFMFGRILPVWSVIVIEFVCAFTLACLYGKVTFKLAARIFNPTKNHPMLFESAIICTTVCFMCPSMSLLAAIFYFPYGQAKLGFMVLLCRWLKLVCYNLPFAYFSQMFFIQPFVRFLFSILFRKEVKEHSDEAHELEKTGKKMMPHNEQEAVMDILKRKEEIKEEISAENAIKSR